MQPTDVQVDSTTASAVMAHKALSDAEDTGHHWTQPIQKYLGM